MIFLIAWTIRFFSKQLALGTEVLSAGPRICQMALPPGAFAQLDAALLCGVNLPASEVRQTLLDTGLIHIMVVSGSHLAFLELLLKPWPKFDRLVTPILVTYCFLVGLEPPVVRALLRRFLDRPLKQAYGVTSLQLEAATIFFTLFLYPPWLTSRSFLMSWMCGLALSSPKLGLRWSALEMSIKYYAFLLPFCWSSPLTILWNSLLAPLVGSTLFPTRLATYFFHFLAPLTDWFWVVFLFLIRNGPQSNQLDIFIQSSTLAFVPLSVHLALLILEVKWRRAHAFL